MDGYMRVCGGACQSREEALQKLEGFRHRRRLEWAENAAKEVSQQGRRLVR
jgi:hypothetical protein